MDKILEYTHLMQFKEIFPDFPDGDVCSTEEPDFITHYKNNIKNIGIELTQIFQPGLPNGTSLQAQDSVGMKVTAEANRLYRERHLQPLHISISPNTRFKINNKSIKPLAEKIVRLIESAKIEPGKPLTLIRSRENAGYFPQEILGLSIFAQINQKVDNWRWDGSGFIQEISYEVIQDILEGKEDKLEQYRKKCEEIWLIIISDDLRNSSTVDLEKSAVTHNYFTGFNRIFFFWNSSRCFIELQLMNSHE